MKNIDIAILNDKTTIGTYKRSSIYRDIESMYNVLTTFLMAYNDFFPESNSEEFINHL